MSVLIKLNDLSIANSTLPELDVSDADVELASLPQLKFWLQAGSKFRSGSNIKERIEGRTISPTGTGTGEWINGAFANSEPAFILDNSGSYPYILDNPYQVNKDTWTAAFVFERDANDVGNAMLMGLPGIATSTGVHLYIGMTSTGLKLYDGNSSLRISDPITTKYVGTKLAIISFSVTNGLTMRINGKEVARAAADKRPLTSGLFRLGASSGTTVGKSDNALGGKLGTIMMFDADLCLPAYQSSLAKLEYELMQKYNINAA
tara:strand:+ start:1842 stop:2627 length:786 start_codon:yes stop_codon:yes gene_type:complete